MFELARKYGWYYLNAKTKHGIHSPFVYDLVTKVLEDKTEYPEYKSIETLRINLLANKMLTEVEDFGAGSGADGKENYQRRISEITARSAKPAKWGKLLYRLARYFESRDVLELGTSLGISTAYLASGALSVSDPIRLVTMEGSQNLVQLAGLNMKELGLADRVRIVQGNFDDTLEAVLEEFTTLDLVFIDGNHRKEPTLRYFEQLLPKAHNDTVFVFDDIHWSREMTEAWEELKSRREVTVSVDLFYLGLVFVRREQVKEDFVVRF